MDGSDCPGSLEEEEVALNVSVLLICDVISLRSVPAGRWEMSHSIIVLVCVFGEYGAGGGKGIICAEK